MRAVAACLLIALCANAQEDVGRPYWVSVPAVAGAELQKAVTAVASGNWEAAAKALQEIFANHGGSFANTGRKGSYVGARHRALDLLATMPAAVREEYERLYGQGAQLRLGQALANDDESALLEVVRRYEGTHAGLGAVLALADRAILRGRGAEARLLLARLRRLHPEASRSEGVLKRMALAAARDHANGGPEPDSRETVAGIGRIDPIDTHAWPMIGGNSTRTMRASVPRFHDIVYNIAVEMPQRMHDHPPRPSQSFYMRRSRGFNADWEERWREFIPSHPVIARGYLVYGTGRQIVSHNLYTAERHWTYPENTEVDEKGRTNLSVLFSPVVADGVVYCAIEVPVDYQPQRLQSVPITYYLPSRRLVAIDLASGDVLWSHEDHALDRSGDARVREFTVVGPPLVRGDRVYVGACRERTDLFHNTVLAFDRRTGKLIYETRISQGQQELNLFGRKLHEAACTPVAEVDGVLYYGTNQGVVAAIDALLGTPIWATTYEVVPIPSTYLWFEAPRRWPRFENGPPMIADDVLLIAPTDGTNLLALQRSTGQVLWSKRFVGDEDFGFVPRVLQATDGERAFVSGSGGAAAIWLRDHGTAGAGTTAWLQRFPGESDTGAGRGLLADGELWIPSYVAIYRYDPVTGKALAPVYRRRGDDANEAVNLVAGDGVLITAGREFLCARYDEAEVLRLAKARVRAHPDEVGPILGAADVYLATGRLSLAVERYREARRFAAERKIQAAEERARYGLHRALLKRAELGMEEDLKNAPRDFEAAIDAAPNAKARLRARVQLDAMLAARGGPELNEWRLKNLREVERNHGRERMDDGGRTVRGWALRQMARILVDVKQIRPAVAVLQRLIENDPTGPDGRHASAELRAILLEEGRVHYLVYEKRARKLFEATLASGDLTALERGLWIYSNAEAAADATLRLAGLRLAAGEPAEAAQVLQRFLVEHPAARQIPQALVLAVRALHARRSYGQAYSALQRLKRVHGAAPVTREDGARVPAATLADEWLQRAPYPSIAKSARRRDLQPNLEQRFEKEFPRRSYVDVPDLLGQRPPALREAVLLRMRDRVYALDARNGDELYGVSFDGQEPRGPLVLASERLLAVTERSIFAFDAGNGRALAVQPVPAKGRGLSLLEHQGQVFLLYKQPGLQGQIAVAALHPEDVTPIWTTIIPTSGSRERVNDRYTIGYRDRLLLFSDHPVRVTVVNTTSGAVENQIALEGPSASALTVPPRLLPDGRVLLGLLTKKRSEGFAWQSSYTVHLIDPSQPTERAAAWEPFHPPADAENRYLHTVDVIGDSIVALDDACGVAVLELRTGKQLKWVERLPIGDPNGPRPQLTANQAHHDSLLIVATRTRTGQPARLSAFEVPSLREKYSVAITNNLRETAELIDADGVLGVVLMPNAQRRTRPRIRLYDPLTAKLLQEILPGDDRLGWFNAKVQNGILLVSPPGNAAYAYGPK